MDSEDLRPASFGEEEAADWRRQYLRHAIRLLLAFTLLFAFVFFAFWWSGSAVRFGAQRAADRAIPTWHVIGTVRSAATHLPIPWADVQDDPAGQPPYYRADGDQYGVYDLLTLAEPHRVRVAAPGYQPVTVGVGRVWFLWLPRGSQTVNVELLPE